MKPTSITWSDQYKHPQWQKKRLEVLEASEFQCDMCGSKEKQLHVHHKQYFKGRMMWEYASDELQALCADCHEHNHKLNDRLKAALLITHMDMEQITGYIEAQFMLENSESIAVRSYEHAIGIGHFCRLHADEVISAAQRNDGVINESILFPWEGK